MKWLLAFSLVSTAPAFAQSTMLNFEVDDQPTRIAERPPAPAARTGGGRMQDCGIPPGPVAYNIGNRSGTGIGRECRPRSVLVGFDGSFSSLPAGTVGMGYINPRLENAAMASRFPGSFRPQQKGDEWSHERIYSDYNSSAAQAYIAHQVQHWQRQGRARGQKCVAVDVDNCDMIGARSYGQVLDTIDRLNRGADVQIRVLVKNPQNAGCGQFLKRPIAVGAFMEELTQSQLNQLSSLRANPDQVLLFARGNNRSSRHPSLQAIADSGPPNSAVSFDSNGSYNQINKCTYRPGSGPSMPLAQGTAVR